MHVKFHWESDGFKYYQFRKGNLNDQIRFADYKQPPNVSVGSETLVVLQVPFPVPC